MELNDGGEIPVEYSFHGYAGIKLSGPFARDELKSILALTFEPFLPMTNK